MKLNEIKKVLLHLATISNVIDNYTLFTHLVSKYPFFVKCGTM